MSEGLKINRPITGDVSQRSRRVVEQGTVEEFLEQLDALLDIDNVEAVRWRQYTPSFNDGDPCEFTLGEVGVRVTGGEEDGGDYEDGFYTAYELCDDEYAPYGVSNTAEIGEVLRHFVLDRFELIAESNFGDPAEVTATKDGFEVEYYDCGY